MWGTSAGRLEPDPAADACHDCPGAADPDGPSDLVLRFGWMRRAGGFLDGGANLKACTPPDQASDSLAGDAGVIDGLGKPADQWEFILTLYLIFL